MSTNFCEPIQYWIRLSPYHNYKIGYCSHFMLKYTEDTIEFDFIVLNAN